MADSQKRKDECGPFIACGASCVSFDHEPGQPTDIDRALEALKQLFSGKRKSNTARIPKRSKQVSKKSQIVAQGF